MQATSCATSDKELDVLIRALAGDHRLRSSAGKSPGGASNSVTALFRRGYA